MGKKGINVIPIVYSFFLDEYIEYKKIKRESIYTISSIRYKKIFFFLFLSSDIKKKIKLRSISYSLLTPISTRRIG